MNGTTRKVPSVALVVRVPERQERFLRIDQLGVPLCCTAHRMMVVRKDCLQRDVSCRGNLRGKGDGLTEDSATVLGDVVFDGFFPAKGLLRANVI